ncbi:MAG: TonB-dependent receptor family protein [Planctomycetota bacterium]|jgi:Fe(3+) dicitrate transport protein
MRRATVFRAALAGLALCGTAAAQDGGAEVAKPKEAVRDVEAELERIAEETEIPATVVIGSREAARTLPGSGHVVESKEMRRSADGDPVRLLRRLPGVVARQEDGYGNFPNLSLRGVDTTRSAKVTIMEDGVLAAPAPYSAPSAYYTPNAERMSAIEVLKGSSQVRHGPHTTGGVVNFLSTTVPEGDGVSVFSRAVVGDDSEERFHGWIGGNFDIDVGELGVVVEGFWRQTEGFKSINAAPGYGGSGRTGFQRDEPMVKVVFSPDAKFDQVIEVKWGETDFTFDEGYLGLTERDFDRDPYQRYAASRFDEMNSEQERMYLRYSIKPARDLSVTATWYYNSFSRDWFKLHDVTNSGGTRVSLANAIATGGDHLDVLRGDADGSFRVRHNNRSYWSKGIDTVTRYGFATGGAKHEAELGIRHHRDRVRRNQWNVTFTQDGATGITGRAAGAPGSAGDRRQETTALATYSPLRGRTGSTT